MFIPFLYVNTVPIASRIKQTLAKRINKNSNPCSIEAATADYGLPKYQLSSIKHQNNRCFKQCVLASGLKCRIAFFNMCI